MNTMNIGIKGIGYGIGSRLVTNKDMEKIVDTTDEWIREKIGVEQRYLVNDDEALSDLAIRAADMAIKDAGIHPHDIDIIIVNAHNHDHKTPATACIVQKGIDAKNAGAFDIRIACAGFIYGCATGASLIKSGIAKNVLVIAGEVHSNFVSFTDRSTCVFFGDGAGAVILSECEEGKGFIDFDLSADGYNWDVMYVPDGGSRNPTTKESLEKYEFKPGCTRNRLEGTMDGPAVFEFATRVFPESVKKVCEKSNLNVKDLDFVVPHQANKNIIKLSMDKLGLPMEKTYINLHKYGNMSSASQVIALKEALDEGLIKENDTIALVGFGAGLAWGSFTMKWTNNF